MVLAYTCFERRENALQYLLRALCSQSSKVEASHVYWHHTAMTRAILPALPCELVLHLYAGEERKTSGNLALQFNYPHSTSHPESCHFNRVRPNVKMTT